MTTVTIMSPKDAGAARISVFAPDGKLLVNPQLVVPPSGSLQFEAPTSGIYTANLEPLGNSQALWSFQVEGTEALTVQPPPLASIRHRGLEISPENFSPFEPLPTHDRPIAVIEVESEVHGESSHEGQPVLVGSTSRESGIPLSFENRLLVGNVVDDPRSSAAYSLGLSYDSRPLSYGGWRPYSADSMVEVRHTKTGDVEIEFRRADQLPAANNGARLRLSLAVETTRVQRILVPLFAGGVVVRVKTSSSPHLSEDKLSITPTRPEIHALLQALTSNSTEITTGIWQAIGADPASFADYASPQGKVDPSASVAIGLLMLRLDVLTAHDWWVEGLALAYSWIADASVLAAQRRLANDPPDVDSALKHLQNARRVGAVYFFEANRLQGDLLVALAADAPKGEQREIAAGELARWRRNLPHQVQVGAFFSWLMTNGARTRGGLDARYSAILDTGRMAANAL